MARPLSLQARSLSAAFVVLAAFLGLAFFALDRAFYEASENALRERLQGYMYAYLAGSDTTRAGQLIPPEVGPDPRFDQPAASGLYAAIVGEKILGAKDGVWRSPSALGRELPFNEELPRGPAHFGGPIATPQGALYVLAQGVDWNSGTKTPLHLTFYVAEDSRALRDQVDVYRRTLLGWLGALGAVLLLLLLGVLRWSLAPLRRVAADLARVERGVQDRLDRTYPLELSGLTAGLNNFIDAERERLKRYRNTLSDLAHSLKTPLAVMRSQLETGTGGDQLRWTVLEQVGLLELRERYPQATVVQGDAYNLDQTLADFKDPAAAVVSGLPLVTKPMLTRLKLIRDAFSALNPGAPFVQFTYSVTPPIPKSLPGVSTEASERIWMNLPPARVWVYRKG